MNPKGWDWGEDHLPSLQVAPFMYAILLGTGNCGKLPPQSLTERQCCGCQPICGLHLIKPGLHMAGENATSMFLKMGQGAVHMGPCVWSSFTVKITPYYSSHALWVFPCYSSFWPQRQMRAEHSLLLLPLLGGTEQCPAESRNTHASPLNSWIALFLQ